MGMGETEIYCSLCWPNLAITAVFIVLFLGFLWLNLQLLGVQNLAAPNSILLCRRRAYAHWKQEKWTGF